MPLLVLPPVSDRLGPHARQLVLYDSVEATGWPGYDVRIAAFMADHCRARLRPVEDAQNTSRNRRRDMR